MDETIEELQIKLQMMKLEEKAKIENNKLELGNKRLEEKQADRLSREQAAQNRSDIKESTKTQKIDAESAFLNMINDFQKKNHVYYDTAKSYWCWNHSSRSYDLVDDTTIMVRLTQSMGFEIINGSDKFKFLEGVRQKGRTNPPKDLPPYCIQFKNKVINIKTGKEFYSTPDCMFTSPLPYNLGSSNKTPTIDKLINEWVHKDNILTIYEIIAYCMYKRYPIAKEFFLVGGGRNGKSQLLKMIIKFIGKENSVSTDLNDIANSRFEAVRLFKKSVALIAETDNNVISKTSTLKALTGEDPIKGEGKGKDAFDFINHAKLIIATNELPETKDKSDGFYRRSVIIDFPNKFKDSGNSIIDTIPNEEYENLGKKLIPILKNLLKRGSFTNEGTIDNKRARFESKSNPILEFIGQSYIYNVNGKIKIEDFKLNLEHWLIERRLPSIKTNKKLFKDIRDAGYEIDREDQKGQKITYVYGLEYSKQKEYDPDVNPFLDEN